MSEQDNLIAIVGMAGRFPEAASVEQLWTNLIAGRESVRHFDDETLAREGVDEAIRRHPQYVPAKGVLDGIDRFDAALFGFSPREAAVMDPQLRLLLTCAWETLESAGCDPARASGPIGLFAGMSMPTYMLLHLWPHQELVQSLGPLQLRILNDKDFLTTWVSYRLDLRGPSMAVQTACSTSLVAVHQACQSLLAHECDAALAGGVTVSLPWHGGYIYQEGSIYAPDGHCRPFDQHAAGTVSGDGCGLVMLKRLADAEADGDPIRAVIRGSAINNDGSDKVGYMAPSVDAQAEVVATAQAVADTDADAIGYIEAHGTGTAMGDPIEFEALRRVFEDATDRRGFCALGSIKSNLGHLDQAAGIAGLIKAALAVERGLVPPTVHFTAPHPELAIEESPFYIAAGEARPWASTPEQPRRAGVSSLGVGGTNAHVVLEEPPSSAEASPARRACELLVLSARSEAALDRLAERLATYLEGDDAAPLADVAHTLQVGRRQQAVRRTVVAGDTATAVAGLRTSRTPAAPVDGRRGVAFLFPGQGSQYPDMLRGLYETEPEVRSVLDRAAEQLEPTLGRDLRTLLFPAEASRAAAAEQLTETRFAQPALFVVGCALARLVRTWGIEPEAMIGHSIGEYVAACVGGTLTFDDALTLVAERGRLMHALPAGAMASVALAVDEVEALLEPSVSVAAINEPGSTVVSGPEDVLVAWLARLSARGIEHRMLHTSHAFHSSMMDPVLPAFRRALASVTLSAPVVRWVSNVTGTWITDEEATDPAYWVRHLRAPVRFADGVAALAAHGAPALLELGPGHTLTTLARRQLASPAHEGPSPVAISSLRRPRDEAHEKPDEATILAAVGGLWQAGVDVDWHALRGEERRRKVVLPGYPFEEGRYWVDPPAPAADAQASAPTMVLEAPAAPETDGAVSWRNEYDRGVAAIFADLLGVDRPRPSDDFFALGGHSLLATRVVARLRDRFAVALPIDALFDAPTVEALADVVRATAAQGACASSPIEIVPRPAADATGAVRMPISPAQERLWFLNQLDPDDAAYHLPMAVRIEGELDRDALGAALAQVVARHESLRTVFVTDDGGRPEQKILPTIEVPLAVVGLVDEPATGPDGEPAAEPDRDGAGERSGDRLSRWLRAEARRPFALAEGPLLRASVCPLGPACHVLLVTLHHIVTDGWSNGILLRELVGAYERARNGEGASPAADAPLPVQYADYATWHRQRLIGEAYEARLAAWCDRLTGAPVLAMPTDRPRPPIPSGRGGRQRFTLDGDLVQSLEDRARSADATLYQLFMAAWSVVLSRWSGQRDLVVGTPVANRDRVETEDLIGFFVNTLALRIDLSGSPDFDQLLGRVRQTALDAFAHQDLPFERVVDALGLVRTRSVPALVQVMLSYQSVPTSVLEAPGLRFTPESIETGVSQFDLALDLVPVEGRVEATLEYNLDVFTEHTAAGWNAAFRHVLEAVAAGSTAPVDRLPVQGEVERRRVLETWADGGPPAGDGRSILVRFAEQVAAAPDASALVDPDRSWTYQQLDRHSDRLAGHLAHHHWVTAERPVAVLVPRSVAQVAAYLATWKAGSSYLPLDPVQPPVRLRSMIDRAQAVAVVTTPDLYRTLEAAGETAVPPLVEVTLDDTFFHADTSVAPPAGDVGDLRSLAYLIFTSGSTGEPKGIEVEHATLGRMIDWYIEVYGLDKATRSSYVSGAGFDAAIADMWPALACGGAVHMPPEGVMLDSDAMTAWLVRDRITISGLPTPIGELMTHQPWPADTALDHLIVGGDKLHKPPSVALPFTFVNDYGPTESTVVVTRNEIEPVLGDDWAAAAPPPIGSAVPGAVTRVLDEFLEPTPVGVAGELYLGGSLLARGYRGQAALTAQRFVPDPHAETPGARLYRTGDRVRWRADGRIDFLERVDHQVQLRGFRIELAEVEAALQSLPGVDAAVAAVRADPRGIERLVAWIASDRTHDPDDLAERLGERLPDYMVPSPIDRLDALPTNANGKVDRAALPTPAWPETGSGRAPETDVEHTLAAIWRDVLHVDEIGMDDNFFALGGDSILSIQVVTRARQAGLGLEPRQLFEHQTVASLARVVGREAPVEAEQGPVTGSVPLQPIQRWFFALDSPVPEHYNQALLFQTVHPIDADALARAVARVTAHHDALRLRFTRDADGGWLQEGVALEQTDLAAAFLHVDLSATSDDQQAAGVTAAAAGVQRGFELERGPLWRCALLDLGPSRPARLLLVAHHLVVDAVSWRIVLEDLATLYQRFTAGEDDPGLPAKTTSWQSWSEVAQTWAADPDRVDELAYWRALPAFARLPRDGEGDNRAGGAERLTVHLDGTRTEAFLRAANEAYGTRAHELLLAAVAQAVARTSGDPSVRIDVETHGRDAPWRGVDVSRTVGWFTAVHPLAVTVAPDAAPETAVKSTKEALRRVPSGGVGYGLLRWSGDDATRETLAARGDADVLCNYLGQLDGAEGDWLTAASESSGPLHADETPRGHLIEIDASVAEGRLGLLVTFASGLLTAATVERFAQSVVGALASIVDHCLDPDAGGYTPADFPDEELSEDDLEAVLAELEA